MTVITFAKKNFYTTSFDLRRVGRRRSPIVPVRTRPLAVAYRHGFEKGIALSVPPPLWIEGAIRIAALTSIVALAAIVFFGMRSSVVFLNVARKRGEIIKIEREVEQLRIEALMRSNPQSIVERVRTLQLTPNDHTRYVSLGAPSEIAMGRAGIAAFPGRGEASRAK